MELRGAVWERGVQHPPLHYILPPPHLARLIPLALPTPSPPPLQGLEVEVMGQGGGEDTGLKTRPGAERRSRIDNQRLKLTKCSPGIKDVNPLQTP